MSLQNNVVFQIHIISAEFSNKKWDLLQANIWFKMSQKKYKHISSFISITKMAVVKWIYFTTAISYLFVIIFILHRRYPNYFLKTFRKIFFSWISTFYDRFYNALIHTLIPFYCYFKYSFKLQVQIYSRYSFWILFLLVLSKLCQNHKKNRHNVTIFYFVYFNIKSIILQLF